MIFIQACDIQNGFKNYSFKLIVIGPDQTLVMMFSVLLQSQGCRSKKHFLIAFAAILKSLEILNKVG